MATQIEVTFAKSQTLPEPVPEGRLQLVDESAGATEVEAYVGTQNGTKKITDKDKASTADLESGAIVPKLADNLTPYAKDSGTTQTQPFFLEGTATGNGESRVDAKQVPAFAFLQEKRGNMICVNQLVQNGDFSNGMTGWTLAVGTSSISGGVCTITSTGGNTYMYQSVSQKVTGHKVLVLITAYASVPQSMNVNWGDLLFTKTLTTSPQIFSEIATVGSGNTNLNFTFSNAVSGENIYLSNIRLVDLTQWFNGNIPAYLLSHPEAFGRYYKGPLTYEPGRLEPATGRYLTSVGRNIWDEEWESGSLNTNTGEKIVNSETIRSKNYISINSNTQYWLRSGGFGVIECFYDADYNYISYANIYDAAFTTPSNAHYMLFRLATDYGTTYNHDITITEYYSGESGYDKYYPHEVLATIDTGTEPLFGVEGSRDTKLPSGLITRVRKRYTFTGNEEWTWVPSWGAFRTYAITDAAQVNVATGSNMTAVLVGYEERLQYSTESNRTNMSFVLNSSYHTSNTFALINTNYGENDLDAFKAYIAGKTIDYPLATPTTEQGTPFQENVPIDDFGQISWSNTNVPQGNQIFYPVDYKAYEDTLIKYTDGDATSLVRKTDYASSSQAGAVKVNSTLGIGINASGAIYTNIATQPMIKTGNYQFHSIVPSNQHESVFYGLAKAAGANLASSTAETAPGGTNPGVYPAAAKAAILKMLLPDAPTTDGTYDLVCTVTNGEPTFSWVART